MSDSDADRSLSITANAEFQDAVLRAVHGELAAITGMDDAHLLVAARSVSVMVAARLVETQPCTLAGFTFWADSGCLTFGQEAPDARMHLLPVTVAQMVTVDATALMNHDFGQHTNDLWAGLLAAVPRSAHRRLALLLAGKFTSAPEPANPDPILEEDDSDE